MRSTFISDIALAIVGNALLTLSLVLGSEPVRSLALGAGSTTVAVVLASSLVRGRGVGQRLFDGALLLTGAWTIVASRAFTGPTAKWLSFAAGASIWGLGMLALVAREALIERELRRVGRFVGSAGNGHGPAHAQRWIPQRWPSRVPPAREPSPVGAPQPPSSV